ncbi:hypothetical protein BHM03_00016013 [Ensete ventricosum]|nr:hypothetical protein BHM03_00016013 [Ensete ventricosum]
MSQERLALGNLGEDVPPATQSTSGGAPQPPPPLSLFGDRNLPSRTPGRYWRLFNDPRLTPSALNLRVSRRTKPIAVSLLRMRQKEDEPLGPYLAYFTKEIRAIPNAHPSLVIQAFMVEIRPSCLFWSLVERPPTTVPEMLQRANQYVTSKALVTEKHEDQKHPQAESSRGPPPALSRKRTERTEQAIPRLPNAPLNSTRTEIFLQIWEKGLLKAPNPMRTQGRDRGRYYRFHYDYEHDTKECYDLKN